MAMEKIELSAALQNLATQTNIDKVTGVYNGAPANIAKADLASVVAGVMGIKTSRSYTLAPGEEIDLGTSQSGLYLLANSQSGNCAAIIISAYNHTTEAGVLQTGTGQVFSGSLTTSGTIGCGRKETNGNVFIVNNRSGSTLNVRVKIYSSI